MSRQKFEEKIYHNKPTVLTFGYCIVRSVAYCFWSENYYCRHTKVVVVTVYMFQDRLLAMEARFKAEKDRYSLVLQRAQTSTTLNDDLKKEYETQLGIFKVPTFTNLRYIIIM